MISKNQAKFVKSLKLKKNRLQAGLFIAEGTKVVMELIQSGLKVHQIYATQGFELPDGFPQVVRIDAREMEQLSSLTTPPGILAVAAFPSWYNHPAIAENLKNAHYLLALDGLRDPGNLGTVIRSAEWFGFDALLVSDDTVDAFNPKVIQAAMGSVFRMPIYTLSNWADLADFQLPRIGLDMAGENLYTADFGPGIYILGNESLGLRPDVRHQVTRFLTIPGGECTESLNAGVSASIVLAELYRRKLKDRIG
jgi:TrmH family RNA methyltransferase